MNTRWERRLLIAVIVANAVMLLLELLGPHR